MSRVPTISTMWMLYIHDNVQVVTLAGSPAAFTTPVDPPSVSLLQLAHVISQAYYLQATIRVLLHSESPPCWLAIQYVPCIGPFQSVDLYGHLITFLPPPSPPAVAHGCDGYVLPCGLHGGS